MADRRKTLLVVDSDEEMRETLTGVLRRDYRVLRAATGEAALQMMQKEDVDLMLLEVYLRGISGFEVLKIIRENYPYVEVIVITRSSPTSRMAPVATMVPWPGIRRGTDAVVPSVPGLVRLIVAPTKSSGDSLLARAPSTSCS